MVRDLATELRTYCQKPFALFGHSLGALIAFELARLLQSEALLPVHLFLSGYGAPHLPGKLPPMHHLDDAGFLAALQELGTTPPAVLADEELLALLLPMLRADFSVYEQYQFQAAEPLPIPITLLGGKRDPLVTPEMLAAWQVHSRQPGGMHLFAGDHFYLQGQETAVWRIIRQVCQASQTTKFNE